MSRAKTRPARDVTLSFLLDRDRAESEREVVKVERIRPTRPSLHEQTLIDAEKLTPFAERPPVRREDKQLVDARGDIGLPYRAETLLERMERKGDIGDREREAGEQFQKLFHTAHLDPIRATDLRRSIRGGGKPSDPPRIEWARDRVHEAMKALGGHGSPCGTCAWFVLGCDLSVREWAMREGWGGRQIREEVAKGTLLGALGVLVVHFRL